MSPPASESPNPWPWGLGIFIALFIAAVVGFTLFSTTQRVDLVADDYYEQELSYQQEIDRHERGTRPARRPSWRLEGESLLVEFPAGGLPDAPGEVVWYRPSDAGLDRRDELVVAANGRAEIPLDGLAPGHWRFALRWKVDGESLAHAGQVELPPER